MGLTKIDVNLTTLLPGKQSSIRHFRSYLRGGMDVRIEKMR